MQAGSVIIRRKFCNEVKSLAAHRQRDELPSRSLPCRRLVAVIDTFQGMRMRLRPFLTILALACAALPAFAFDRPFPQNTKRGTMSPGNYPEIVIDGQLHRLSPGARIWNANNLIEMPAYLRGSDFTVNYTEDMQGAINRVWILSPQEANESLETQINRQSR